MNRTVPHSLQEHLDSGCTTVCVLIKITPRTGGDPLAMTSLDVDVEYDDGETSDGAIVYHSAIGIDVSTGRSSADMAVDNAEGTSLVDAAAEFDVPVSEADLASGIYDFAEWVQYLVNYEDLTMGHVEIGRGTIGQVRVIENGLKFTFELLGLTHPLKQSIVERDSLRCRARFGSQPIGTVGAESTERFPCGKDTSAMWVAFEVTAIGSEPQSTFDTDLAAAADTYKPGLVRWTVGRNAGRQYEVEAHATGGIVTTTFPMTYPVEVGDEGEIRADCTHWKEGANGCEAHHGADWVLHYRGEPWIPVGEQDQINIPGANG